LWCGIWRRERPTRATNRAQQAALNGCLQMALPGSPKSTPGIAG
jgi:hypothetical protein